jgi:hypothetical protein
MLRNARIDAPGVLYYIIVRGIERRKIFPSVKQQVKSQSKNFFLLRSVRKLGYTMADLAEQQEIRTRPSLERIYMECAQGRRFSLY